MMRILTGADVPPDPNAGAAGTEMAINRALRELGHTVDEIWAGDLGRTIRHGNLHYLLELPRRYRRAVTRRCASTDYDVVQLSQPHAYLAARDHRRRNRGGIFVNRSHGWELRGQQVLGLWRRRLGVPEWGFPRSVPGVLIRSLLARHSRAVCASVDGIIVSCRDCRDFIVSRHGLDPRRVAAVPQAAPEPFLREPCPPMAPSRLQGVLHISQFRFMKAPMIVADAVNRILGAHPDCRFTWVCEQRDHAAARALLSEEASRRTSFVGWQEQRALMRIYDAHGVFLFLSFFEGFGKVFLEALSRGMCVVASQEAGMRDIIQDGGNGFLVPVGDGEAAAAAAGRLLGGPQEAAAMARAARETALRYTWTRAARETAAFYERLLSSGRLAAAV
jgi:glycosyltransferase involved in cell wall biosynthesis